MLLGILLPLLALEIGFRVAGPFLPGDYDLGIEREFDPILGWRHRPGFTGGVRTSEFAVRFAINQHGLRDEEIPYEKPAGGFRVLALGDSFLAAAHVPLEQAMTKILQGELRDTLAPRPVDVVNAGVAGYGTAQEYLYLDTEGYKYSPDLVLVVVFLGNDLNDNIRSADGRWDRPVFKINGDGRLEQVSWPEAPNFRRSGLEDFLVRNSTVYNFIASGVFRKVEQGQQPTGETGRDPGQDFQIYQRDLPQKYERSWEVTEALLRAIADRAAQIGARTLVVGAPSFRQLDPERFNEMLRTEGLDPRKYDIELPNRLLRTAAERQQLPYLDLLPALRAGAAAGIGDMFYPKNTHWAPAGQRTVARALFDYLVQHPELLGQRT